MNKKQKLVYGVGLNDANYIVQKFEAVSYIDGRQKRRRMWICPFYQTWKSMLERCYSCCYQQKQPTYIGCSVCEDWLTFSNFKSWMEKQAFEGKHLDKDILFPENKVYSPEACCFVNQMVNNFLLESNASRGQYPIGVCWHKASQKFVAQISDSSGTRKHLGLFSTPKEAHQAWLKAKLELAKQLASELISEGGDVRIAEAIVKLYENYEGANEEVY